MNHSHEIYELLQFLSNKHRCSLLDLLNEDGLPGKPGERGLLVQHLANLGLISVDGISGGPPASTYLQLTGSGLDLLFRFQEVTPIHRVAHAAEQSAESAKAQVHLLEKQVSALEAQVVELSSLKEHLEEEARHRAKDDRFYFWLGVLFSFITAIAASAVGLILNTAR